MRWITALICLLLVVATKAMDNNLESGNEIEVFTHIYELPSIYESEMEVNNRRNLASASITQDGNTCGSSCSFTSGDSATVSVSTSLATGDELWYYVTRKCYKSSDFYCTESGSSVSANKYSQKLSGSTGSFIVYNEGTFSVRVIQYVRGRIYARHYNGQSASGTVVSTAWYSQFNNATGGTFFNGRADDISAQYFFYIKAPVTGNVYFVFDTDDGADVYIDGTAYVLNFADNCICQYTFTKYMVKDQFYYFYVRWHENSGGILLKLNWSYSGQSQTIVPSTAYFYPSWIGSTPFNLTYSCEAGMALNTTANPDVCYSTCGDGLEASDEGCDDGNRNNGDGCSSSCTVEAGWVCSCGSGTSRDSCTLCSSGYYQNDASNPETCVTRCGDGLRRGSEVCDDNDTGNGDGCSSSCAVESGWVCDRTGVNAADVCTQCSSGYYQDDASNPRNCVTQCGDGLRRGDEVCDDNDTGNGDGCTSSCTVESGWVCDRTGVNAADVCEQCGSGYYQDSSSAPRNCVTHCGDGLRRGSEVCDDDDTGNGDGCTSSCTVEAGWVCDRTGVNAADTCTQCSSGYYQDDASAPRNCVTQCGDGLRRGSEVCDDNDTGNGDGCSSTCAVEAGWVCDRTGVNAADVCEECSSGYYQDDATNPRNCVTHCGDGLRRGSEVCDDNDTGNGDGCTSSCTVEAGWVCDRTGVNAADVCEECSSGYYQDDATSPRNCVTHCGDGLRRGSEVCDDDDTGNGDGCSSTCTVEAGWVCDRTGVNAADVCEECALGFYQDDATNPRNCVTICGDGLRAGTEICDDDDTDASDGCSATCMVETGWVCDRANVNSADICELCAAGFYQDDATYPRNCVTHCGDGLEAGTEKCDDDNTVGGDGCAADCSTVETNWVCIGGSDSSKDVCEECDPGFYQNDATNPEVCVTHCGDGLEAGTEKCDDDNTVGGDGCAADCSTVETNWVCIGGSPTTKDVCEECDPGFYQNDATNPEVCVTICGDGLEAGTEKCDDGNTAGSDGCAADCSTVEASWVCRGGSPTSIDTCEFCTSGLYQDVASNPEYCVPHCGDSLEAGNEKCDDGNTVGGDGCNNDCSSVEANWVCRGGSPTTIDVCEECEPGYYQDDALNPEYCVPICGDGLRIRTEQCDDGGNKDGDGCDANCVIESNWACADGTPYTADVCVECYPTYEPNSDKSECIITSIPSKIEFLSYIYLLVLLLGLIFNFICCIFAGYTAASIFSTIYQIQILMLTPLTDNHIHDKILFFYRALRSLLAGFLNIPSSLVPVHFGDLIGNTAFMNNSWYLYVMGFESGSSIENINNFLLIFIAIAVIGLIIAFFFVFTLALEKENSTRKTMTSIATFTCCKLPIRLIMVSFVFLLITGMPEVFGIDDKSGTSYLGEITPDSESGSTYSLICAYAILAGCGGFFTVAVIEFFRFTNKSQFENAVITKELFSGLKDSNYARIYPVIWILRRILFVGVLVFLKDLPNKAKLGILCTLQVIYMLYLISDKVMNTIKDRVIEIINELGITACYITLIYADSDKEWSSELSLLYIILIFLCNSVVLAASIVTLILKTIMYFAHRKPKVSNKVINISKDQTREEINVHSNFYNDNRQGPMEEYKGTDYPTGVTLTKYNDTMVSSPKKSNSPMKKRKKAIFDENSLAQYDNLPNDIKKIFGMK